MRKSFSILLMMIISNLLLAENNNWINIGQKSGDELTILVRNKIGNNVSVSYDGGDDIIKPAPEPIQIRFSFLTGEDEFNEFDIVKDNKPLTSIAIVLKRDKNNNSSIKLKDTTIPTDNWDFSKSSKLLNIANSTKTSLKLHVALADNDPNTKELTITFKENKHL